MLQLLVGGHGRGVGELGAAQIEHLVEVAAGAVVVGQEVDQLVVEPAGGIGYGAFGPGHRLGVAAGFGRHLHDAAVGRSAALGEQLNYAVGLAAAGSLAVETLQYALELGRVSSIDDMLLNAAGATGMAGLVTRHWWRIQKTAKSRPASAAPDAQLAACWCVDLPRCS